MSAFPEEPVAVVPFAVDDALADYGGTPPVTCFTSVSRNASTRAPLFDSCGGVFGAADGPTKLPPMDPFRWARCRHPATVTFCPSCGAWADSNAVPRTTADTLTKLSFMTTLQKLISATEQPR